MKVFTLRAGHFKNYYFLTFEDICKELDQIRGLLHTKDSETKVVFRSSEQPEINYASDLLFIPGTSRNHDNRICMVQYKDINTILAFEERMLRGLQNVLRAHLGEEAFFVYEPIIII